MAACLNVREALADFGVPICVASKLDLLLNLDPGALERYALAVIFPDLAAESKADLHEELVFGTLSSALLREGCGGCGAEEGLGGQPMAEGVFGVFFCGDLELVNGVFDFFDELKV